ncbi:hypothetical protein [uncultured Phocaeicola sp.]|uniref:hypothetical protein n=1 Tax=uncultured Phocaeicola sp. TaxID=990718 RepID=UPI0025931CC0|nr:hypothetical protein [uncultured Phocaeicola sp.]
MSGVCDNLIKQGIVPSCDDPIVPGIEQKGVMMNRADIDFGTTAFNSTRKNIIETLALKSGKKAYEVVVMGSNPFTGTNTVLATGTYRNTFTNTVNLVVLDNGPDVCANVIDGLANGEFVVILENKFKGLNKEENPGDAAFQVYGWYQGLKPAELSNDKYSEETDGGWLVSLQEAKVPKSALFLFKTDYETTAAAVATLTKGAVGG